MNRPSPGWVLAVSLLGISFAGPLVRLSNADPLAIAAWRLCFSLVIVAVALAVTGQWRDWAKLTARDTALASCAGIALALHFWAWNASIHLTTIAASVTLVSLQPAVIVAISTIFLREAPNRRQLIGISIALLGAMLIAAPAWRDSASAGGSNAMLGNMLAASAAVTAGIYYTIGRHLRATYGIWAYVALAYSACAIALFAMAGLTGTPLTPQPPRELAIFAGLAIGPMLLGHTGMNWALKYLPAYVVNLTVLGEPVGATLLGALIPAIAQVPPLATLLGGVVVLAGVLVAAWNTVSTRRAAG
ncbi:MAG: DMT family transporter [Gemmatimonadaceae bacterium]|nr:DMT family transporter [Gemmatimonadaceae bacterium]